MPAHHSQLSKRIGQPVLAFFNRTSSQMAVNNAKATCSEGKALAARSSFLSTDIRECCDQSTAKPGTAVGQLKKMVRPIAPILLVVVVLVACFLFVFFCVGSC